MTTNKAKTPTPAPAPLREQIVRILTERGTQTRSQIVPLTSEANYESRVTTELNRMRADGVIECAKKAGKNELEYWLAVPGALAFDVNNMIQLPSTAADPAVAQLDRLVAAIKEIRQAAGVSDLEPLDAVAPAVRALADRAAALDKECEVFRKAVGTLEKLNDAHALKLQQVCFLLRDQICPPSYPADMDPFEMAEAAIKMIRDLRDATTQAAPQRADPVGFAAMCDGELPRVWSRDYEYVRAEAESLADEKNLPVVVVALTPLLRGEVKRSVMWSAQ